MPTLASVCRFRVNYLRISEFHDRNRELSRRASEASSDINSAKRIRCTSEIAPSSFERSVVSSPARVECRYAAAATSKRPSKRAILIELHRGDIESTVCIQY